jgi:hypothetical protein
MIMTTIFGVLVPCKFIGICQYFRETYCLHLRGCGDYEKLMAGMGSKISPDYIPKRSNI